MVNSDNLEPVAWIGREDLKSLGEDGWCVVHESRSDPGSDHAADIPLYAAPSPSADPAEQADATGRTSADYALEHAEYLALAAQAFIDAVVEESAKRAHHGASKGDHRPLAWDQLREAEDEAIESMRVLSARIYEFRKRRDRAAQPQENGTEGPR
jgi:hypothetical protein